MNEKQYIAIKTIGVLFFLYSMFATTGAVNYILGALCVIWCIPEWVDFYYSIIKDGETE